MKKMPNTFGLDNEGCAQVKELVHKIGSISDDYPATVWLTTFQLLSCSVFSEILCEGKATKGDAMFFQRIINEDTMKFIRELPYEGKEDEK